jgi:hypothetical protein
MISIHLSVLRPMAVSARITPRRCCGLQLEKLEILTRQEEAANRLRIAGREAIRLHEEESHPA